MAATAKKPHKAWSPGSIGLEVTYAQGEQLLKLLPKDDPLAEVIRRRFHPKTVEVCSTCGNSDIQMEAWIMINGAADGGGDPPGGTWCGVCGENDISTQDVDARWVNEDPEAEIEIEEIDPKSLAAVLR